MINLFTDRKPMPPFREYQVPVAKALVDFIKSRHKYRSGLIVAPTSFGKSLLVGFATSYLSGNDEGLEQLAIASRDIKSPTLVIQPNGELLEQNYKKFIGYGGQGSIYSASAGEKILSKIVFCTPGSIVINATRDKKTKQIIAPARIKEAFKMYGFENIIVDECEFNAKMEDGSQFMAILDGLKIRRLIGLTASPVSLLSNSVKGPYLQFLTRIQGTVWKEVIHVTQIQQMAEYWSDIRYKLYDFDEGTLELNSKGTDFLDSSIKVAVKKNNVNNNIYREIQTLLKEGKRKSIILYCDTIENANKFQELFPGKCYSITSKTKKATRDRLVKAFKNLEFPILANVSIFTVGFDHPELSCILYGYPTNSWRRYYQTLGRGVRPGVPCACGSGKFSKRCCQDFLVIDFCNNVKRFGRIENITIEKIEGYGWGVFNGEELLTDFGINDRPRRTKKWLRYRFDPETKKLRKQDVYRWMHFGAYQGVDIKDVPTDYLIMIRDLPKFQDNFRNILLWQKLKAAIRIELNERKLLELK